jgi:hypothetical protein
MSLLPNESAWVEIPGHLRHAVQLSDGADFFRCGRCHVTERNVLPAKMRAEWISSVVTRHGVCVAKLIEDAAQ